MKFTSLSLTLMLLSCQTKTHNENLSETKAFAPAAANGEVDVTNDFKVLAVSPVKDRFCVVKLGNSEQKPILELWTPLGSISPKSLRQSLRYAGYLDHTINEMIAFFSAGVVSGFEVNQALKNNKVTNAPIGNAILIVGHAALTYEKGKGQNEQTRRTMTVMSLPGLSWISERVLRGKRSDTAKNEYAVVRVPQTQLDLWKERLLEAPVEGVKECDQYALSPKK